MGVWWPEPATTRRAAAPTPTGPARPKGGGERARAHFAPVIATCVRSRTRVVTSSSSREYSSPPPADSSRVESTA